MSTTSSAARPRSPVRLAISAARRARASSAGVSSHSTAVLATTRAIRSRPTGDGCPIVGSHRTVAKRGPPSHHRLQSPRAAAVLVHSVGLGAHAAPVRAPVPRLPGGADRARLFYGALAGDAVGHVSAATPTSPARAMLDVGGGPGYFRDAFEGAGATYFALDADVGELSGLGASRPRHGARAAGCAAVPDAARSTSATPPTCSSTSTTPGAWRTRWCG